MSPTHTSKPAVFSPEQIYNLIMAGIEPDLTTDMIPLLDVTYENESPEETIERGERYAEAFEEFELRYDAFVNGWKHHFTDIRQRALHMQRDSAERGDNAAASAIEQSLLNS